jgi:hypothetical protein
MECPPAEEAARRRQVAATPTPSTLGVHAVDSDQRMSRVARISVELDQPAAQVFEQVIDLARYSAWNPFVVKVEGAAKATLGAQLTFDVRWPGGGGSRPNLVVTRFDDAKREVAWAFTGALASMNLVRAERVQRVVELSPTRCRYESEETFTGALVAFVPLSKVQAGIEAQARAMSGLQPEK